MIPLYLESFHLCTDCPTQKPDHQIICCSASATPAFFGSAVFGNLSLKITPSLPTNRACAWQGPFCHLLTYSLLRHYRVTIFGVRNSFSSHRMAPDTLSNDKHPHQLLTLYMLSRLPSNKFQSSPVITYVMCP